MKEDKYQNAVRAPLKSQPQSPARSKSLMRPQPQSPKENLLYDGYKHMGPNEIEHKLAQMHQSSPDEKLLNLYDGYKRLYDVEKERVKASVKKRQIDDDYVNAVKNYRSQTLNGEHQEALKQQILRKTEKARADKEVGFALDANVQAQLAANEGLVQTYPAITFTPDH